MDDQIPHPVGCYQRWANAVQQWIITIGRQHLVADLTDDLDLTHNSVLNHRRPHEPRVID